METYTLVIIKPDAIERRLGLEIIEKFVEEGFILEDFINRRLTREEAEDLYAEHKGKSHFNDLVDYTISGPSAIMLLKGYNAVAVAREMIGEANPEKRKPGTLRDLYALDYRRNSVHGSDSDAAAKREIEIFF